MSFYFYHLNVYMVILDALGIGYPTNGVSYYKETVKDIHELGFRIQDLSELNKNKEPFNSFMFDAYGFGAQVFGYTFSFQNNGSKEIYTIVIEREEPFIDFVNGREETEVLIHLGKEDRLFQKINSGYKNNGYPIKSLDRHEKADLGGVHSLLRKNVSENDIPEEYSEKGRILLAFDKYRKMSRSD